MAAGFTKYTFNYPTKSGVFGWQITPRGNFLFRTRVGVIQRYAQSRLSALGCLRRVAAQDDSPIYSGD